MGRTRRKKEASAWPVDQPTARFWIFALVVMLVGLGGGSRSLVPSLLVIRPACVFAVSALVLAQGGWDWSRFWPLVQLLAAWTLVIAIQLVPLPPGIFLALPGRSAFAQAAVIAGQPQPWRPISLAPDLTINSLLALLIPATTLVAFAGMNPADRARTPVLLLGIVAASALLAVVQLSGGQDSAAYLYQSTSVTLPVGLLANRNHQATLMAIGLAVLVWRHFSARSPRTGLAAVVSTMLFGMIFGLVGLVTGSRSGLLLMGSGLVLGFGAGRIGRLRGLRKSGLAIKVVALFLASVIATLLLLGRATGFDRLADADGISGDLRFRALPVMIRMVRAYMPVGTGFGTFDSVFRIHEPDALLNLFYFNNAHDDFLEVLITGGVPAVAALLAALAWLCARAWALIKPIKRGDIRFDSERARGRLGLVVLILLAAASLSDYPLRTPLMALIGSMALCWVAESRHSEALVSSESLG